MRYNETASSRGKAEVRGEKKWKIVFVFYNFSYGSERLPPVLGQWFFYASTTRLILFKVGGISPDGMPIYQNKPIDFSSSGMLVQN